MKTPTAYTTDLAYVHHVGFGDFARDSAPGLLGLLHAACGDGGQVVDLGCGSGLWAAALLRAGYDVTGVDPSSAMLVLARQVAPGARFVRASAYDFDFPACDAVTAVGEVLSYLPPGAKTAPALPRLFRRIAGALRPGGLLVFDLIVTEKRRPMAYRTWRSGGDWAIVADVTEQPARRRLVRQITTFRRVGARYRRSHETHVVRICPRAAIERMLRQAGFSVRVLRGYGTARLAPRRLVFRARKTGRTQSGVTASGARISEKLRRLAVQSLADSPLRPSPRTARDA